MGAFKMERDSNKCSLSTSRVSIRLQARDKVREEASLKQLRLYLDTKLRESISTNILQDSTPYRCSLSRKTGLAATRGKHAQESTFSARKKLRERELNTKALTLPRLATTSTNLVSVPLERTEQNSPELSWKRGEKRPRGEEYSKASKELFHKTLEEAFRASHARHGYPGNHIKPGEKRPKIIEEGALFSRASPKMYVDSDSTEGDLDGSDDEFKEETYSKTCEDGSKITASQQKLRIEIFMPKIR